MSASAAITSRSAHSPMTVGEFVTWDSGDQLRWQLVDGEPVAMAPTQRTHGAILIELGALLRAHLRGAGGRCSVVAEPGIVPRGRATYNYRIPDLGVTCTPYVAEERDLGDPLVLVEIISSSNERQTRLNVWTYTSIPSVQEILIVHTSRIGAELLRRNADGTWPDDHLLLGEDDTLALASIDFACPLRDAYATTRFARTPNA